jgi:hypothetical protein
MLTLKKHSLAVALIILSITSVQQVPASSEGDYILRGVYQTNTKLLFSIESRISGRRGWVAANRAFEGLVLDSYDSHSMVANGTLNEKVFTLPLHQASRYSRATLAHFTNAGPLGAKAIEEAVKAYATTTFNELPPKNHPLYAPMKLSADNQITSFRQALEAPQTSPETATRETAQTEATTITAEPVAIRRNRVNSRIWASDHIELHGLPELQ